MGYFLQCKPFVCLFYCISCCVFGIFRLGRNSVQSPRFIDRQTQTSYNIDRNTGKYRRCVSVSYTHLDVYKRQAQGSYPSRTPPPHRKSYIFPRFPRLVSGTHRPFPTFSDGYSRCPYRGGRPTVPFCSVPYCHPYLSLIHI